MFGCIRLLIAVWFVCYVYFDLVCWCLVAVRLVVCCFCYWLVYFVFLLAFTVDCLFMNLAFILFNIIVFGVWR